MPVMGSAELINRLHAERVHTGTEIVRQVCFKEVYNPEFVHSRVPRQFFYDGVDYCFPPCENDLMVHTLVDETGADLKELKREGLVSIRLWNCER